MKNTFLQELREKQGLSQRVFAEKTGISRGRLRRLEGGYFSEITFKELQLVSGALGVTCEEFFRDRKPPSQGPFLRRSGEGGLELDFKKAGFKTVSFFPEYPRLFAGKIFVSPKKRLPASQTPQAPAIFLHLLLGTLSLELGGKSYEIREGDSFLFCGNSPYTLENPLLRDSVGLLVTLPASL